MNSHGRVLAACAFEQPDRIPVVDFFWSYPDSWQDLLGPVEAATDVVIWCPNEGTFPSRARRLRQERGYIYEIDRWGRTIRRRPGAYFSETLAVPITDETDLDRVSFEPPDLDSRFLQVEAETVEDRSQVCERPAPAAIQAALRSAKQNACLFGKTGGPYLRSTYVRGEAEFLMDIAADPARAKALADRMADHLAVIGVEQIRRWDLSDTGIWIFDDIAHNFGPMFSPRTFESVFLPAYRRMVSAFKRAGARYVFFHSDGDIRRLLDMLIDAGIDGINPVEPRANMDVVDLRRRYPNLILTGGLDNTGTLIRGPIERIEAETRAIIDIGRDGGVIIGSGYIGPEIPLEHYAVYRRACDTYGAFAEDD